MTYSAKKLTRTLRKGKKKKKKQRLVVSTDKAHIFSPLSLAAQLETKGIISALFPIQVHITLYHP